MNRLRGEQSAGGLVPCGDEARLVAVAAVAWVGTVLGLGHSSWAGWLPVAAVLMIGLGLGTGVAATSRPRSRWYHVMTTAVLMVAVLLVTVARGALAAADYRPMESGRIQAVVAVRGDPHPMAGGWRAEVQTESGERLEATAFGRAGFALRQVAVGERLTVTGRVGPVGERPWLQARHIVGRLTVEELQPTAPAGGFDRMVNSLRSVIIDGGRSFDDRHRSLYTGLVIGDDRFQPPSQQAQFRASGLTHLLAVSGQNVAFVLLVVRPLILMLGRRLRLGVIVAVLVGFAAVTRAEPSVLRAATVAAVATWAALSGRVGSGLRTLAAGVVLLVLVDPFLVNVVGFRLSVAASAGIILFAPLLLARLPGRRGPARGAAQALAVTVGAQLGVAPLLILTFGPLPLASIPANLLAGWAAGAVMTLGLTIGPVSGMFHRARLPSVAAALQWPAEQLVGWIDLVAGYSSGLPLPRLGFPALVALTMATVALRMRPRNHPLGPLIGVVAVIVIGAVVAPGPRPHQRRPVAPADGLIYLPSSAPGHAGGEGRPLSVLVVLDARPGPAIDGLLLSGIDEIDVVISQQGNQQAAQTVTGLGDVADVGIVLAPPRHRIRGATRVTAPVSVPTASGPITVAPDDGGSRLIIILPPALSKSPSMSRSPPAG